MFYYAHVMFPDLFPSIINNKSVMTYKAGGMYIRNYYGTRLNGQPSAIALAIVPSTGQLLMSDQNYNVIVFPEYNYWLNTLGCNV